MKSNLSCEGNVNNSKHFIRYLVSSEPFYRLPQVALVVKKLLANACRGKRHKADFPGSGRSPGGYSNPLQCSCLENPMDRGAWWGMVHRVTKGQT